MQRLLIGSLLILLSGAAVADSINIRDSVREEVLDNGMKILLVQKPGAPMVSAGWVAHVGSANEQPGITGISHLFEHMMFKGSPRIGTRDNSLDSDLRVQLDDIRQQMFDLERQYRLQVRLGEGESVSDPALQSDDMAALKKRFEALIEQQRENTIKDEFDQIYTEAGATGMNAFTNQDMTVYFIRVPRNKLELWFWMESERLAQPVFREFYSERDVVYEERRMRTDSTPTGAQNEVFNSLLWRGHPYGWPVVGWPSDISAITREQAEAYFDLYYAPNNITLALVGDFNEQQAMDWANDYFGRIPRGRDNPPDVVTLAMPMLGNLDYRAEVDAPPSASIHFRTAAFNGKEDPALQVLGEVLSGKTGRLYKRMVLEDKIATATGASNSTQKYDGEFVAFANGTSEVSPDRLKAVILEEIDKIKREGITEYELQKVQNQLTADMYRRLEDNFFLLIQLLYYDGLRDWTSMDTAFARVRDVSTADVQRVAQEFLVEDAMASKLYTRKESDEPEDPELAQFDAQQQQMIQQMMGQMGQLPVDQIPQAMDRLRGFQAQAPEEAQAAITYVLAKLQDQLDAE